MATSPKGSFDIASLLAVVQRRRWLALTLFGLTFAFVAGFITFLPNVYTASTLLLVEGPQVAENYVRPAVHSSAQTRLYAITQEVLSRARLERLSRDFNLYRDPPRPLDDTVGAIRKAISIELKSGTQPGALAFSVGYSGTDPQQVLAVAQTLASFYIDENLKKRNRQATGTTKFLQLEIQDVKKRLEAQEQVVTDYKKRFLGELPEQLDMNLKTLERLQMQFQVVSESIARAQERRKAINTQIETLGASVIPAAGLVDPTVARIQELRRLLAELRTRYFENYPDVQRTKQELSALERELRTRPRGGGDANADINRLATSSPLLASLFGQIKEIEGELRIAQNERAALLRDIATYQARIENTPKHEQELLSLSRDYNSTRDLYASLLKRQEEANLAGNLEQQQQGEQLRILDPAVYPQKATGPARTPLYAVALLLSLGVAIAGVFLWEKFIDQSFHRPEDLEAFAKTAVLVTLPDIITDEDRARSRRRRYLGAAAFAASLYGAIIVSQHMAATNEQLALRLGKRSSTAAVNDARVSFGR